MSKGKLKLAFFIILVLILFFTFFFSPYNKIQKIYVTGNDINTRESIIEKSGLKEGSFWLGFINSYVESEIKEFIGLKDVVIKRKFPGIVYIHVLENERLGFIIDKSKKRYIILDNGKIMDDSAQKNRIIDRPLIFGEKTSPWLNSLTGELKKTDSSLLSLVSEIHYNQKLKSTSYSLILYMKDNYEIHTNIEGLSKNLLWYPSFVENLQLEDKKEGIINLMESKWYEPFVQ